jgi:uncharacterized Zn-binding protein involved in type VI secretion
MSFPAARQTDMTATSDVITGPSAPTVLTGGLPTAVMGDAVAGPVLTGAIAVNCSVTVLVAGRPAAHMMSVVSGVNNQSGAPVTSPITMPCCPTVLFGG